MADMLNVAVSGLRAFQRALDTTSHNIANAATPGYSRQRVELVTREPQSYGGLNLGTGVQVGSVDRYYDSLLTSQLRTASSGFSRTEAYSAKADQLNNLFADSASGMTASLQKFSNALQAVSNAPSSSSARQTLMSEAQGLVDRMKTYDRRLDEIDADITGRLEGEARTINSAAQSIAALNLQIVRQQASTGQAPNDLLDQRDRLITDLSTHVNVSAVPQDDGQVNLFIGNGQALVLGGDAGQIVSQQDPYLPTRSTLAYRSSSGSTVDLTGMLSGGTVGGLIDFRREMLDPVRNEVGQIAVGVASAVNAQHREGMDLAGAMGGDFFNIGGVGVQPRTTNTGVGTVDVERTGAGALTTSNYMLQYSGGAWTMRNQDTGTAVALTGAGTTVSPFVGDGLSIDVSGFTPANGDTFLIQPTANAIDGLSVALNDPSKIAAAAPIRTAAAGSNLGTATISAGEVLDPTNAALRSGATITFIDATHYSINGAGNFNYASAGNIDANGWRVAISGAPQAGDTFTVSDNTGGIGDNRNALELSASLGRGLLSNGTQSVNGASSGLVGRIGVAASQAQVSRDAQKIVLDDTVATNDEVSGVNLDEEAANLIRYQQAYAAAAQVIRVTQDMFNSLLSATGR
ncbi:MAG: flagellar hook-associated protein FlgK [Steroidobacteraceae bacterium]